MKAYFNTYKWNLLMVAVAVVALSFGLLPDHAMAGVGLMALSTAPFPITPELTAVAIAYRNKKLIADDVLPRTPVGKQEFKYQLLALGEGFTVPDTRVGRKSKPNEVSFSSTEQTASCEGYGLDDPIPQDDIDNAAPNQDPLKMSAEQLTNLILLDREIRTANLVFNANTYGAANKVTLSGTGQWSDYTNSDPIGAIMDALDSCIMRPNIAVFGRATASVLSRHPKVVKAVHGNSGDSGIASRQALAELLELDDVLIGEGFVNTARKGQPVAMQRVWGKHASFIYRDKLAGPQSGTTFGFTAQWGGRIAGAKPDSDIGLRGGQRVRVGEYVKELVTAGDLGYFFQNAVA
jgi:hypothetical protein